MRITTALWGLAAAIACGASYAQAPSTQPYPTRPVWIVTGSAGSNVDVSSRIIEPILSGLLGQSVVIDNRAGAIVGGEYVAKAPPDGYMLLLTGGSFWVGPLMRDSTPYDPVKDFTPVTYVAKTPAVLVVNPSLPVKSVPELIAYAKAHQGELNYSSGGMGGAANLAAELFNAMAAVKVVAVFYKGDSQQITDLLGGRTQLTFGNPAGMAPLISAGKVRGLAVTSAQPSALFPGLPAIAAAVPGYESVASTALFAPAKTPAAIVQRLNRDVVTVLHRPEVKEKFLKNGLEIVADTPEDLAAIMHSEVARMGKVIKDAGIKSSE